MNDLLSHPAVQAGPLPFVVAFVLALLLGRTRFSVLAVASGLVVLLAVTIGFSLEPLTSSKKMIVAIFGASAVGLALEATGASARRELIGALAVAAGAAALWALSRVLAQREGMASWTAGAGALAFVAATVFGSGVAASSALRASVVGAVLGWGSGVLAILGASALLGQVGLALGSASAAVALMQMIRGESPCGWTVVLPAAVGAALVGVLAVATAELRWWCLLPLLLVPLAARWVPTGALKRPWQAAFATGFAALVPVVAAVGLAWLSGASSSAAG